MEKTARSETHQCPECGASDHTCKCPTEAMEVLRKVVGNLQMPIDAASVKQAVMVINALAVVDSLAARYSGLEVVMQAPPLPVDRRKDAPDAHKEAPPTMLEANRTLNISTGDHYRRRQK